MKKIYLGLFLILFTGNIKAQLFEEITGTPFEGAGFSTIAFADINSDNDQDVIITGKNNSQQRISKLYTNDGNGNFEEVLDTPFDGVDNGSIAYADIDNDGDQDVLITGESDYGRIAKLYANDGNGNFEELLDTPFEGVYRSSIAFADIDNDNDQDVLITGRKNILQHISKLYTNDGNGNFTVVLDTPFEGVGNSSIAFADIDNDGDQDVLVTGSTGDPDYNRISKLYSNDGNGNYEEVTGTPFEGVIWGSIAFADINNDGDQDVLITGDNDDEYISKLYSNDGNGNFTEVTNLFFEGVAGLGFISFADIDNDNNQDVLITGANNSNQPIAKLYTNNGNEVFTEVLVTPFEEVYASSIAFADIDTDGDQDVLITGWNGDESISKLYRNLSPVGINENTLFSSVSIFPNPNNGLINIDLGSLNDVSLKIFSVSSHLIYHKENINTPLYQFELDAAPGIYIIELSAKGERQRFKLVKH